MAPLSKSLATALDPPALPQASFARADELISRAMRLRVNAQSLKARANEDEEYAERLDKRAAELQASAEEDREYVQNELDNILEYHNDVLKHFLLIPDNKKEVEKLTTNVEEGRTYIYEVSSFGEKLLQFRAADLAAGQQIERNSSTDLSTSGNINALESQLPFSKYASLPSPFGIVMRISTWRSRIDSFLGNGVSDIDRPADSSSSQIMTDGTALKEEDKNDHASTAEKLDLSLYRQISSAEEALGSGSNASISSISSQIHQDAVVPPPGWHAGPLDQGLVRQNTANNTGGPELQGGAQAHEPKEYIPLQSLQANAQTKTQPKATAQSLILAVPEANGPKKSRSSKKEMPIVFKEQNVLTTFRQMLTTSRGTDEEKRAQARAKVRKELKKEIRKCLVPEEKKNRVFRYVYKRLEGVIKREMKRMPPNPSKTDDQRPDELKRKRSESVFVPPAAKKIKAVEPAIQLEKEAWFNEMDTLGKYRKAFAEAKGSVADKRAKAYVVTSAELNGRVATDKRISGPRKTHFSHYANKKIDAIANKEIKLAAQGNQSTSQVAKTISLANVPEEWADDAMMKRESESESRDNGGLADLYTAELSDGSVDDSQYP